MNQQQSNMIDEIKLSTHQRRNKRSEHQFNDNQDTLIYNALKRVCTYTKIQKESIISTYLTHRSNLIQTIRVYCKKYNIKDISFYAAISYLDKIMSKLQKKISKKQMKLYAITCVILALKFVENEASDINLITFANINDSMAYNRDELHQCEIECVQLLEYQLDAPTIYEFLRGMISYGVLYYEEVINKEFPLQFHNYSKEVLFKIKDSFDLYCGYHPEMISMAIIQATRSHFSLNDNKMKNLMKRFKLILDMDAYDQCYAAIIKEQMTSYKGKNSIKTHTKIVLKSLDFYSKMVNLPPIQTEFDTAKDNNDDGYDIPHAKRATTRMTISKVLNSLKDNYKSIETSRHESNTSLSTYTSVNQGKSDYYKNQCNTENSILSHSAQIGQRSKRKTAICIKKSCFTNSKLPIIYQSLKSPKE